MQPADPIRREFLSDADNTNYLSTEGFGEPWSLEKARWVMASWEKAAGRQLHRHQAEFMNFLHDAFRLYENGVVNEHSEEGRVFSLLRPGAVTLARPDGGGTYKARSVVKKLSWTPKIRFSDPFYRTVGAEPLTLFAEQSEPNPSATWVTHLGEAYFLMLEGTLNLEWLIPTARGFEAKPHVLSADSKDPHIRGAWFKTECPVRAFLPDRCKRARALMFFSDPLGRHTLISASRFDMPGLGAKEVDPGLPPEQLWAIYSGIGARIERVRRMRGWTIAELAKLADIQASHLSKIEDAKIAVSIQTAASIAANLDVPLSEILPDDILTYITGCYLNRADPVWLALQGEPMPATVRRDLSEDRQKLKIDERVQIPYEWKQYGLMVLPAGSPRAKSLLPVVLHIGKHAASRSNERHPLAALSQYNYNVLCDNSRNDFRSYPGNMVIFVRDGHIRLRVCRFADLDLFPFVKPHRASHGNEDRWFDDIVLKTGDLIHLNCEHLHKLEIIDDRPCALVCVTATKRASQSIRVPRAHVLRDLMPVRDADSDFMAELLRQSP